MILGYTIKKIEAIKDEISGKVDISSTVKIENVEEKEIEIGEKRKVLEVSFSFEITYKPSNGKIYLEGSLLFHKGINKEILKTWEKNKKLPEEVDIEIKNFLLKKCLTLALLISEELRMPSPLPFPMIIKKKNEAKNYIG
ncbi:MAG: hypothetical protein QXD89_02045 [Candidatus Aenigmatarchaeota archaeon]